jgi:acetylornithine deacetylase
MSQLCLSHALQARREDVCNLLCDLIRIPSTVGQEGPAMELLAGRLHGLADEVELVPVPQEITQDPDYSWPIRGLQYEGRPNLRVVKKGSGPGALLFNTHLDVVPPSATHDRPFDPRVEDGLVWGRGACDAKGQVACAYALLAALHDANIAPPVDLIFHFVIEEEVGGNGTVAMVRRGEQADACVVLEPSEFVILPQIRGAVWFDATVYGQAGHSGKPGGTVSALFKAIRAIQALEAYHDRCIAESRGHYPLFDAFENPAPLTIGQMIAGDWPAQAPQKATFRGVLGILPDRTKEQVMAEMEAAVRQCGDPWLNDHFEIEFTYRHDASVIDPNHPLVAALQEACKACGIPPKVSAMTASCDAWMYTQQLNIPTLVFGPGSLGVAHSDREHIALADVLKGAEILGALVQNWTTAATASGGEA